MGYSDNFCNVNLNISRHNIIFNKISIKVLFLKTECLKDFVFNPFEKVDLEYGKIDAFRNLHFLKVVYINQLNGYSLNNILGKVASVSNIFCSKDHKNYILSKLS